MKELIKEFIKITQPIGYTIIGTIVVSLPFFIASILWGKHLLPFNFSIPTTPDTWFSFIGSYLGAIGAFSLGYVAFKQNEKYNDQSTLLVAQQQDLLKKQTENLLRHKYYDNYVAYIERLEQNYNIIKYYSAGWFKRFVAKKILNDVQKHTDTDVDILVEQDEQKERMEHELMEVGLMFGVDLYFFKGKTELYNSFNTYKKHVKALCELENKMDETQLRSHIDIANTYYKDLIIKFHQYILEVKFRSLDLLEEDVPVDAIKENITKMSDMQERWLQTIQESDDF